MPLPKPDWINAILTGGAYPIDPEYSGVTLVPDNLDPNPNWRDVGADGEPLGTVIVAPPVRVGRHPYATRPGMRPVSATTPDEEETPNPPKSSTLVRQTSSPMGVAEAWNAFQALVSGTQPDYFSDFTSLLPKALAPTVTAINASTKGFPDDTYGVCFDLRFKGKPGRTRASGFSFINVADFVAGNSIRVFIGSEFASKDLEMGVYVTRPGSGGQIGTERQLEVIDLSVAAAKGYWDITGPYNDNGKRPATNNESGLGRPLAPARHRRPGRFFVRKGHARFDLQPGRLRIGGQIKNEYGISLFGHLTDQIVINSVQKNTALWVYPPNNLPPKWRWAVIVFWEPLTQGGPVWYRVYRGKSIRGGEHFYGKEHSDEGVAVYGYIQEKEPSGIRDRLAEVSVPTEDTSGIEDPSSDSGPEVAPSGPSLPDAPAHYLIADAEEDNGGFETIVSDPVKVILASGQTIRSAPTLRTNQLRNPQGSERLSDSTAADWTGMTATGTATAKWEDGLLKVRATGTGIPPNPTSAAIPVGQDTDLTVFATMEILRVTGGTSKSRLYLSQFQDNNGVPGTFINNKLIFDFGVVGKLDTHPEGVTFGPNASHGGTTWDDGTAWVKLIFTHETTSWNSDVNLSNLALFVYPAALRKWESLGPGVPANFAPNSAVSFPHSSAYALGPVPQAETTAPVAEPLVEEVTFEPAGAWDTDWVALGSNNLSDAAETASPIFGAASRRIQDTTTNNIKQYLRRRTFTGADLADSTSLHIRWYDKNPQLPTKGELLRARILDASGVIMGSVYYTSTAMRLYRHKTIGDRDTYITVLTGLSANVAVDAELGITGGGTTNGAVVISAGTGGNPRTPVGSHTGRDFTGRLPRLIDFGGRETDSAAKWNMLFDNLLVSKTGAPLDYENPGVPAGLTAPDPDAPPDGLGGFKLYDVANASLNQLFMLIEPGIGQSDLWGVHYRIRFPMIPGQSYTTAVQGWWWLLETGEAASHQFFITLHGEDKEPLEVGSPFGAGAHATEVSRTEGARSSGGMANSAAWATEDFYQTFTVPEREDENDPGYTWAEVHPKGGVGGIYKFLLFLFAKGSLTTQAARDAMRDYGRTLTGSFDVVVDSRTPENVQAFDLPMTIGRLALGVRQNNLTETGVSVSNVLYRSGVSEAGPWSTAQSDPTLVPENSHYRVTGDLVGTADASPEAEVFLITAPYNGMLLRKDRTQFPGGTLVENLAVPPNRRKYDILDLGGDVFAQPTSKEVAYLPELEISVFSEEAQQEIEEIPPDGELIIEHPTLGGTGRFYVIRPGVEIDFDEQQGSSVVRANDNGSLRRYAYAITTIPARKAQVLEDGPLISP